MVCSKLELSGARTHVLQSSLPFPLAFSLSLSLSLSVCAELELQENDYVWNNPIRGTNIIKPTVCFTCKRKDQRGARDTKTMAGDDSTPCSQPSHHLQPMFPKNQDKHCIVSHELRHCRLVHSLPQPALAPYLIDRLHHHDVCMAVPLLST